jgi:hypothetical protein
MDFSRMYRGKKYDNRVRESRVDLPYSAKTSRHKPSALYEKENIMAKKVTQHIKVSLEKNTLVEKGGAWLLEITIYNELEGSTAPVYATTTSWANASAAKRWVKKVVVENTPRKSIKLIVTKQDTNSKPITLIGDMTYKVDA